MIDFAAGAGLALLALWVLFQVALLRAARMLRQERRAAGRL